MDENVGYLRRGILLTDLAELDRANRAQLLESARDALETPLLNGELMIGARCLLQLSRVEEIAGKPQEASAMCLDVIDLMKGVLADPEMAVGHEQARRFQRQASARLKNIRAR